MAVKLQQGGFDVAREIKALTAGRTDIGAVVTFTGICREGVGDQRITAMTLEHYPAMAQAELERIEAEAWARWPLQGSTILHRYGRILPGEDIVLVVTASAHRQAAFEAASFLMDFLKTRAPFWKLEETVTGDAHWVAAKSTDDDASARWHKD